MMRDRPFLRDCFQHANNPIHSQCWYSIPEQKGGAECTNASNARLLRLAAFAGRAFAAICRPIGETSISGHARRMRRARFDAVMRICAVEVRCAEIRRRQRQHKKTSHLIRANYSDRHEALAVRHG